MEFDLDELKHKIPLLDYIKSEYPEINTRVTGQKTFVCCPFHDERTPSCLINEDSDTFHCYSCHGQVKMGKGNTDIHLLDIAERAVLQRLVLIEMNPAAIYHSAPGLPVSG